MTTICDPKGSPAPENYQHRVQSGQVGSGCNHPGFESRM
jgi:hypothetical protein